jgi:hypothetical protein
MALLIALLIPNVTCSLINIGYNEFLSRYRDVQFVRDAFRNEMVITLNILAYTAGILILWRLFRPVCACVGLLQAGGKASEEVLPALRKLCLTVGNYVAWTTLAAWILTGIMFPSWMEWRESKIGLPNEIDSIRFIHFVVSHFVCGLMAAALAFYFVTFVAVRHLYPALIATHRDDEEALVDIARLRRLLHPYFLVATMVPVLTLIALAIPQFGSVGVLTLVSGVALVALVVPFRLRRAIESDLSHLELMLNPDPHVLTESVMPSSWLGS